MAPASVVLRAVVLACAVALLGQLPSVPSIRAMEDGSLPILYRAREVPSGGYYPPPTAGPVVLEPPQESPASPLDAEVRRVGDPVSDANSPGDEDTHSISSSNGSPPRRGHIYDLEIAVCISGGIRTFGHPGVHQRLGRYLVEDSGADVFFVGTLAPAAGNEISSSFLGRTSGVAAPPRHPRGGRFGHAAAISRASPPGEDLLSDGLNYLRASVRRGKEKKRRRLVESDDGPAVLALEDSTNASVVGRLPSDESYSSGGGDVLLEATDESEAPAPAEEEVLKYLRILPTSSCESWWQLQVEDGYAFDVEDARRRLHCRDDADFTAALMQTLWVEQCFRHVRQEEILTGKAYDLVVRARPDNGVVAPIQWDEVGVPLDRGHHSLSGQSTQREGGWPREFSVFLPVSVLHEKKINQLE